MHEADREYTVIVGSAVNDRMYEHFEFLAKMNEAAAKRLLDQLVNDMQ